MAKISISSPFEEEKHTFEAEIDKVKKMSDEEREQYLANIEAERERNKERYIEQYGQDSWDKLQAFIDGKRKEIEESEEENE